MAQQHQEQDNWSASNYDTHASFVPKLGNIILDKLDAKPSERILDFGCGDGVLTEQLAKKCHTVVGIDASTDMIDKAKSLQSGIAYHVVDGHYLNTWFDQHEKQEPFDAVFSNASKLLYFLKFDNLVLFTYIFNYYYLLTLKIIIIHIMIIALHWLKEPVKAIKGIHHVLKSNGRFVAEMGGFMNCGGKLLLAYIRLYNTFIFVANNSYKFSDVIIRGSYWADYCIESSWIRW